MDVNIRSGGVINRGKLGEVISETMDQILCDNGGVLGPIKIRCAPPTLWENIESFINRHIPLIIVGYIIATFVLVLTI